MTTRSRAAAHAALEEEESSELSSVPSPTAGPNPEQPGIPVITPKPEDPNPSGKPDPNPGPDPDPFS